MSLKALWSLTRQDTINNLLLLSLSPWCAGVSVLIHTGSRPAQRCWWLFLPVAVHTCTV